ncbi:hypothetical protein [Streptomyces olindensis]|uniref:hypothetical protein n=1 Tax=Streptomyces olindensis TaxID=358823 RepID=UPI0033E2B943
MGRLIGFERRMAAEADRIRREQKVTVIIRYWRSVCLLDHGVDNPCRRVRLSFLG